MQCSKCGAEIAASTDPDILPADYARVVQELAEARQQQAATGEILGIISRSPSDLQPMLDAVAESATRLCEAFDASIYRVDGDRLRLIAHHGPIPSGPVGEFTVPLVRGTVSGRAVLDARTVQVADLQTEVEEFPEGSELARRSGSRTSLSVPLVREGVAIGTIHLHRTETQLFTERQVALLQIFANQAVIAIENARLFAAEQTCTRELTEALEQQTAMSEVLRVISGSPTELQPVLHALVKSVSRLYDVDGVSIFRLEGDGLPVVAHYGSIHPPIGFVTPVLRGTVSGRCVLERRPVEVADLQSETVEFPEGSAIARKFGHRTIVAVPLLREGVPLGAIVLRRTKKEPFTHKQIELVTTFADQAVIAIENARLFEAEQTRSWELQTRSAELAESLEYQTAISEVLNVISRSPNELQPVLDAIVQTARRLCGAERAIVTMLRDGKYHLVAHDGVPPDIVEYLIENPFLPDRSSATGRVALERKAVHIPNVLVDSEFGLERQRIAGSRTALGVPLLSKGEVIGVIAMWHSEVKPFTEKQIELVKTFADQAVIAINNVGLFEEVQARTGNLQESLEYQTAISDVLNAISHSPNELQPVLDTIVEIAGRLCNSENAFIFKLGDDQFRLVAANSANAELLEFLLREPPRLDRGSVTGRAALERAPIHISDVTLGARLLYAGESAGKGWEEAP
jgi:GAF domain-containing protein